MCIRPIIEYEDIKFCKYVDLSTSAPPTPVTSRPTPVKTEDTDCDSAIATALFAEETAEAATTPTELFVSTSPYLDDTSSAAYDTRNQRNSVTSRAIVPYVPRLSGLPIHRPPHGCPWNPTPRWNMLNPDPDRTTVRYAVGDEDTRANELVKAVNAAIEWIETWNLPMCYISSIVNSYNADHAGDCGRLLQPPVLTHDADLPPIRSDQCLSPHARLLLGSFFQPNGDEDVDWPIRDTVRSMWLGSNLNESPTPPVTPARQPNLNHMVHPGAPPRHSRRIARAETPYTNTRQPNYSPAVTDRHARMRNEQIQQRAAEERIKYERYITPAHARRLRNNVSKSLSFEEDCITWIDRHDPPRDPEEERILHALRRAVVNQGNRDRARNLSTLFETGSFRSNA